MAVFYCSYNQSLIKKQQIKPCNADSPIFKVTVMIFSDIVESVMLLKDEDWRKKDKDRFKFSMFYISY